MTELERLAMRRELARIVTQREAEQEAAITEREGKDFALTQVCANCGEELTGARKQAWNVARLCQRCDK